MAKYTTETDHLFQWSQGYRLQVPKAYKDCVTQFYSEDYPNGLAVAPESYEKEGGKILCPLPNQLTVNTNSIIVYAYRLETGKAYTESKTVLSVWARPKPEDYVFVPTDVVTYQTAIELIADMRESLEAEELRVEAETLRAEAEALRIEAEASRVSAEELRTDAEELRVLAEAVRSVKESDREEAEESRVEAESSRVSAEASRTRTWSNATATATDGDTPQASVTLGADGVEFDFTLVRGLKGDKGDDGYTPVKGVDYNDGYTPRKGIDYFDGEKGDTGDTGNGISSVQLISGTHAAGTTDTYRITMTNGTTFDFGVYNGANGQAGEGTGDMLSAVYDPQHRNTDIFAYVDNKESFSGDYNDLINKPSIPSKLSDLSADSTHRVVTDAEKTSWNAKSTFSGNYSDLNGKPTIPTQLSQLGTDTTHRVVTDTEKSTWNAKSDFSGSYNDLTNKPTIPTALSQLSADSTHRLVSDTEKSTWNGKADKVLGATEGHIATLDADGNLVDGGNTIDEIKSDVLTSDVTYYVSTTGSDSNDGLTEATAFRTIQHAIGIIPKNLNGCIATIKVVNGTYNETLNINRYFGGELTITDVSNRYSIIGGVEIRRCSAVVTIVGVNEIVHDSSINTNDATIRVQYSRNVELGINSITFGGSARRATYLTMSTVCLSAPTNISGAYAYGHFVHNGSTLRLEDNGATITNEVATGFYVTAASFVGGYGTWSNNAQVPMQCYGGIISNAKNSGNSPVVVGQALMSGDTTPQDNNIINWTYA